MINPKFIMFRAHGTSDEAGCADTRQGATESKHTSTKLSPMDKSF